MTAVVQGFDDPGRVVSVTDAADPRLRPYVALTDVALRRTQEPAEGLFIAEGEKVIRRAVAAGYPVLSFLLEEKWCAALQDVLAKAPEAPVLVTERAVLDAVTGYAVHRGALAAMGRRPLPAVHEVAAAATRLAVLEDFVDHTNVGAAFRSAAGMGVDAVLVTPRCADPLYRRSVKVSMGAVFQVPWTRMDPWPDGIDLLRELGFTTAALALHDDAMSLDQLALDPPERLALVLGTEGDGLRPSTVAAADLVVRIPMAGGVDSLNVAAAAAVAFHALRA
jgi:tRNA G18 (ribose-2'-O)-methylase SpoU